MHGHPISFDWLNNSYFCSLLFCRYRIHTLILAGPDTPENKRAMNSTGPDTCIPYFLWSQTDSIPKNLNYRSVALFCCYSELFVRWYKLFGLTGAVWRISSKTFYTAPWKQNILQEERMMPKVFRKKKV